MLQPAVWHGSQGLGSISSVPTLKILLIGLLRLSECGRDGTNIRRTGASTRQQSMPVHPKTGFQPGLLPKRYELQTSRPVISSTGECCIRWAQSISLALSCLLVFPPPNAVRQQARHQWRCAVAMGSPTSPLYTRPPKVPPQLSVFRAN